MPATAATIQHIDTIGGLARRIWLAHYPAIIGQEQTEYMLEHMYAPQVLERQMREGQDFFIWEEEGVPVGFAAVDTRPDPGFLAKFYLDSAYRGRGIAQEFLSFLEGYFRGAGKTRIRLTVNRQNVGAVNFYFKTGFKIVRSEDTAIGGGYFMNDFVMEKAL